MKLFSNAGGSCRYSESVLTLLSFFSSVVLENGFVLSLCLDWPRASFFCSCCALKTKGVLTVSHSKVTIINRPEKICLVEYVVGFLVIWFAKIRANDLKCYFVQKKLRRINIIPAQTSSLNRLLLVKIVTI